MIIDFQRHPDRYRHWKLSVDGAIATLTMAVDPEGGLADGYTLKLNSYDLGVDIELADAVAAAALRAPRGAGRRRDERARQGLLRGREHLRCSAQSTHALQGELLQVHERDAQRASKTHRGIRVRSISPR